MDILVDHDHDAMDIRAAHHYTPEEARAIHASGLSPFEYARTRLLDAIIEFERNSKELFECSIPMNFFRVFFSLKIEFTWHQNVIEDFFLEKIQDKSFEKLFVFHFCQLWCVPFRLIGFLFSFSVSFGKEQLLDEWKKPNVAMRSWSPQSNSYSVRMETLWDAYQLFIRSASKVSTFTWNDFVGGASSRHSEFRFVIDNGATDFLTAIWNVCPSFYYIIFSFLYMHPFTLNLQFLIF